MGATADEATFRHVIGHFASGVTVITTRDGDTDLGATASAVSSLSLEPPMLLVCLNLRSGTQEAVHRSRAFGVNILDEDQGALAERFASRRADKFTGVNVLRGEPGVALLADALAWCECRVVEDVTAGTHRVFLAEVTRAVARTGNPLTYFRGSFGRFETAQDVTVYSELRGRVLNRTFPPSDRLDLVTLAGELAALPSTVYHALTRLVAEGLLGRDPVNGWIVRPITVATSDEAHDARCAIELGVATMAVGQVTGEDISRLRRLMDETAPLVAGGRFTDVRGYAQANAAFHSALVGLAGNPTLLEAYDRLCIPGMMVALLDERTAVGQEVVDDHRELVDAFERGDLARARQVIVRHNEHAKQVNRGAIEAAGGQL